MKPRKELSQRQPTIMAALEKNKKYPTDSPRHKLLTGLVRNYLCTGLTPLHTVDTVAFRNMLDGFDPKFSCPGRNHFTRTSIPDYYNSEKKQLAAELKSARWISVTTDGWTSVNADPYLSLTSHYITTDWQLKCKVLFTMYAPESHTADHIAQLVKDGVHDYGLRVGNIVSITTDSAANMVAAARKLGVQRLACVGHILHNAINKGLDQAEVNAVLKVCRRIVSLIGASSAYRLKLVKLQQENNLPDHQLLLDVSTRWMSKHKMMGRIIEQLPALTQLFLDDRKNGHLTLTWQQISTLKNVVKAIDGFPVLTDLLSAEKQVTVSSIVPLLEHVNSLCRTIRAEDDVDEDEITLCNTIRSQIKAYIASKYQQANAQDGTTRLFLRVAEFLDPRYVQQAVSREPEVEAGWITWPSTEAVKAEIVRLAVAIDDNMQTETQTVLTLTDSADSGQQVASTKHKTFSLASLLTASQPNGEPTTTQDTKTERASRELEFYLQVCSSSIASQDVLEWWKAHAAEYPFLSNLSRKILTTNASSVASERLFSLAGNIVTKKRNNLKPNTVDMLAFLAFNCRT